jgi:SAM-dependent methyltransferase
MSSRQYWENIHRTRAPEETSWYQPRPELSLELIAAAGTDKHDAILDVGGGASRLVDCLLEAGYTRPAVLDISPAALTQARQRQGVRAREVEWFETDVTGFAPPHRFQLWHDRALFHFLIGAVERQRYVAALKRTLAPGGRVILATFAATGPEQCSGLPVARYDAAALIAALGGGWRLLEQRDQLHTTPRGVAQRFSYFLLAPAQPLPQP